MICNPLKSQSYAAMKLNLYNIPTGWYINMYGATFKEN